MSFECEREFLEFCSQGHSLAFFFGLNKSILEECVMKNAARVLCIVAILGFTSMASAVLTGYNCDDDGDGVITMGAMSATGLNVTEYQLNISCVQQIFGAGHIEGDFDATEGDPIIYLMEEVLNDTGYDWTGYQIDIGMDKTFSILTSPIIAPTGWTYSITQPTGGQPIPNGGTGWLGTVNFTNTSGDPQNNISDTETGTFGFKVSFLGSVAFCTEQTPVPEPATLALLLIGMVSFIIRRK
jgi:hypothetical protein